ncbi:unnamed protein product [Acanthoscelides obtectus]|uniref:Major facilitator superfamily (MFS) profile domain-containing protein n=1 Tax=Acanthoscelides obtectus TaxID=200917 RepID=A0A9P0JMR7_ACAOB|nr:unnamed protein product [Acanthoscelides obtectus]CAK1661056.1 Facilitated trehalose transporter Tret1-2 homolog [Acanthoscelides obtectus]
MVEGYSAVLIPQLEKEGDIAMDVSTSTWIASISALPTPIGCVSGGWLMDLIGRRAIHIWCCLPCFVGWLAIALSSSSLTVILIGRFVTGYCLGLLGAPTGVYCAETADPKFRGVTLALISVAMAIGVCIAHILGAYIPWQRTALVGCIFPIICILIMIPAPESPTFLAKVQKIDMAEEAFYWCRGKDTQSAIELKELLERQRELCNMPRKKMVDYLRQFQKPEFYKPLLIMLLLFFTVQWSGAFAVTFYNVMIVKETIGDSINEYTSMIVMDSIRLVGSIVACYLLKKVGRRTLTLFSCCGTCVSLFVVSLFCYVAKYYPELAQGYSLVPLTALVTYTAFLTMGLLPVPWALMGEVFPLANRGLGTGLVSMLNYAYIYSVVQTTPWLFTTIGAEGVFMLYGTTCLVCTVLLAIVLPETKNKPLYEIEDHFKGIKK